MKPGCDKSTLKSEFLLWPPDLFALTSCVLESSEAYLNLVSPRTEVDAWPPYGLTHEFHTHVLEVAKVWREQLELIAAPLKPEEFTGTLESKVPNEVCDEWDVFHAGITEDHEPQEATAVADDPSGKYLRSLVFLHAVADEVFSTPLTDSVLNQVFAKALSPTPEDRALAWAPQFPKPAPRVAGEEGLASSFWMTLSTISPRRARVLPKSHTPQVGLSLRSLSHHLAFVRSPIDIQWLPTSRSFPAAPSDLRVLLLPWPRYITRQDFRPSPFPPLDGSHGLHSYFEFLPPDRSARLHTTLSEHLDLVFDTIREEGSPIDLVVMPEGSLSASSRTDDLATLCAAIQRFGRPERDPQSGVAREGSPAPFFVVGCRNPVVAPGEHEGRRVHGAFGSNFLVIGRPSPSEQPYAFHYQSKHHRWKLDPAQIRQYGLSASLATDHEWFEAIDIPPRKLFLAQLNQLVTVCPLICEDLARQDPVGDVVRALGPTLVVALLLDGPQYRDRWASKHASVLSEDPGSSVLTLTSVGMIRRWTSAYATRRNVIGLWKDVTGLTRELEIDRESLGLILTLDVKTFPEYTVDGRIADRASAAPDAPRTQSKPTLVLREYVEVQVPPRMKL
ncbi:MAG: hypothetical protein IPK72_23770 [Candidatus Eisenbacteria bacterium]|nr:hypothetical protein [Candidatus Eisenbacteria bacterium]